MNVLCICLSPAVDATVRMDDWPNDGCVIKNAVDTFAPGGKGINVARWLALRSRFCSRRTPSATPLAKAGPVSESFCSRRTPSATPLAKAGPVSVVCAGLLGEDNAAMFEKEFAKYGIEDRFVRVPGSTRVNEMFVTPHGSFKVNRPAFPDLQVSSLLSQVTVSFQGPDVVIFSGSLPRDWPTDTYRSLIAAAKAAGAKTVLDASGKALAEGVKAHPDVIKPNAEECEALIGFAPKTPEDFKRATVALKAVCDFPIISDGGAGCWFDGEFVAAPKVDVLDTTAAGDTLLAEWCWRMFAGLEGSGGLEGSEVGRWAVAAGSAACTMPGGEPPPLDLVKELYDRSRA